MNLYLCIYVYLCRHERKYICVYALTFTYVCFYVRIYACIYVSVYIISNSSFMQSHNSDKILIDSDCTRDSSVELLRHLKRIRVSAFKRIRNVDITKERSMR